MKGLQKAVLVLLILVVARMGMLWAAPRFLGRVPAGLLSWGAGSGNLRHQAVLAAALFVVWLALGRGGGDGEE